MTRSHLHDTFAFHMSKRLQSFHQLAALVTSGVSGPAISDMMSLIFFQQRLLAVAKATTQSNRDTGKLFRPLTSEPLLMELESGVPVG
jgi:hypothetical protein